MFEVGFGELLLIAALALVVLGPERLPKVAQQIGRWVGRARNMARQFREQLEEEVNIDVRPTPRRPYTPPPETPPPAAEPDPVVQPEAHAPDAYTSDPSSPPAQETSSAPAAPVGDDHFSHAHGDGESTPVSEPEYAPLPPGDPVPETAATRSEHERGT
jgi:sec-independent protein translocase protein TatB